ncbi:hypothetical protein CBR_g3924 [Chara braunii]|uniref:Retrotransposon gag domain-containing protein n=1 Tax=Chara braunii TaxID=69332 RepID=A0A388KGN6_CHABU|nr:hypothetical protein CBR_g3924 [Chara braunii]|eukprot:GBG69225.1 hypothetical protein CBR_g3924 [Chara braunii]
MEDGDEAVGRVRKHIKEPLLNQAKELGNKIRENGTCQDEGKPRRVDLVTKELESLFREDREIIQAWRSDFLVRVKAKNLSREGAREKSAEDVTTEDKASEPPTFRGYGITEYLEKWELHASRSQWYEEEIIENFLFNVDPSLSKEVKEARPKDGKWTTYKKNLIELYKLEDNKYSIKEVETMNPDEDESVQTFGKRFQKISDVLMKKGKISEVEHCTIFIGHLSNGRQKNILRDLLCDKLDFPEVLKLAIKAEADDYKDLVWRGMRRRDFFLYKEYATDRCPDFKDYPWSEKNEAVAEEVKEIRDMVKGLTRQTGTAGLARRMGELGDWMITRVALAMRLMGVEVTLEAGGSQIRVGETDTGTTDMRDRTEMDIGTTDMRGRIEMDTGVASMREEIETETDEMTRADGITAGDSRGRSVTIRGGWYDRGDRRDESRGRYGHGDRRNDSRGRYEQGGSGGDRRNDSRGRNERGGYGVSSNPHTKSPDPRAARGSTSRSADDRPLTPRNFCVYCRGDDHIKRGCPDLKRAIDEGLVVLDNRKYVKWADDLGDVSMSPSMKENVEARRVKPSKGKEPVRSQSIKITFEGDMATTPIRVTATKSARGSTSKKTDTDYVMAEKDGQRIDGEEVILSPRKRGVKKFLMKSSLDEIDTVEPLRRALQQPMQCSILEYLAASKPARDEL